MMKWARIQFSKQPNYFCRRSEILKSIKNMSREILFSFHLLSRFNNVRETNQEPIIEFVRSPFHYILIEKLFFSEN